MTLDPIWQQQLTLVSYGNQFLQQAQPIQPWLEHAIFYGQQFEFRDLNNHALLAPHFQVWLQGLKAQGVQRLSLHAPQLLAEDKNPNPNVQLIDAAPVMVSHSAKGKQVWIVGTEIAQWDDETAFAMPITQRSPIRRYQFWRYELAKTHQKAIEHDLKPLNWDLKHQQLNQQFLAPVLVQGFVEPSEMNSAFYGSTLIEAHPDAALMDAIQLLPIIPHDHPAPLAHEWLHRVSAIADWQAEQGISLTAAQQAEWQRAFTQLIVDIANHYPTAHFTPVRPETNDTAAQHSPKAGATVWSVLLIVIVLCAAAYYFNL